MPKKKEKEIEEGFKEWNKNYKTDVFKLNPKKPKELMKILTTIIKDAFYGGVEFERGRKN